MRSLMDEFLDPSQRLPEGEGSQMNARDGLQILSPNDFSQQRYNMRKNTRNLINNIDDDVAQNQLLNQKKGTVKSDTISPTSAITNPVFNKRTSVLKEQKQRDQENMDFEQVLSDPHTSHQKMEIPENG